MHDGPNPFELRRDRQSFPMEIDREVIEIVAWTFAEFEQKLRAKVQEIVQKKYPQVHSSISFVTGGSWLETVGQLVDSLREFPGLGPFKEMLKLPGNSDRIIIKWHLV